MKIGILGCFYNCEDLLPHVLQPWLELKTEGHQIVFSIINAQFNEYHVMGYSSSDTATQNLLLSYESSFKSLIISQTPLSESEARTQALKELLKQDVDLVWLLDGDEVYTKKQIQDSLQFIERTSFDYYHIYLHNRIFDTIEWNDDFFPPRVFRTNRHDGLDSFTWDNELIYKNGTHANSVVPGIIPKSIAFVNHFTWRRRDAAQKIAYHKKHFGYCMYRLTKQGDLEPDPSYFIFHGIPIPYVQTDGTIPRSPKPVVDVIFRSHSLGNFRESIVRATDALCGKSELTIRALRSVIMSLLVLERVNDYEIRLSIVDDHSDAQCLAQMERELSACPFPTKIINTTEKGNVASMFCTLEYAKSQKNDFIYFVEDDYLHEASTLQEMLKSWQLFARNIGHKNVALFPVDQTDYYLPQMIEQTRVVPGTNRHWRVSYTTPCTFFVPRGLFDAQWHLFIKNPQDNMREDESINVVWQKHSILFTPLPTLAIHVHGEEQMPPFSNWRKLWSSLEKPLST